MDFKNCMMLNNKLNFYYSLLDQGIYLPKFNVLTIKKSRKK